MRGNGLCIQRGATEYDAALRDVDQRKPIDALRRRLYPSQILCMGQTLPQEAMAKDHFGLLRCLDGLDFRIHCNDFQSRCESAQAFDVGHARGREAVHQYDAHDFKTR